MKKIGAFQKKRNKVKLTLVVSRGRTLHHIDDNSCFEYRVKKLAGSPKKLGSDN